MVITCPSCKRRFNLPAGLVRSRHTKLKCSRCKATFTQDLGELVGVAAAKLTEDEERLIATLPAKAPPAARPSPPGARLPPGARPPDRAGAVPPRAGSDTAKQPIFTPAAMLGAPRRDFDEDAPTKQMAVVTSRRTTAKTPSVPPVAPPAAPAARPPPPPAPVARPPAPPRPAPQAPPRVVDGYESYGEAPAVDADHEEALARADAAHAELEAARLAFEQAEAEARAQAEAAARAAEEAARAQAAVEAALDEAMRAAAAQQAQEAAEAAAAQQQQAEQALLDAQRAQESYAAQERVVEDPAADPAAEEEDDGRPPVEGGDIPIDVPLDEGPATPAPAPVTDPRQRALDMFGAGVTPSGRIVLSTMVDVDDVLELSDEERPSPWRWVGVGTGVLLVLLLAFFLFVVARNDWRLDFANFGAQTRHAFGFGGPVQDDRTCLAASARIPALVRGRDGMMVIVRGTINNFCQRSIAGAGIRCTLDGPGGPWTDTARPFSSAGASDLTEEKLADRTTGEMSSEVGRRENSAGVVLPGTTHEFWCTFPSAAGSQSRTSQFRPSFEVTVP